MNKTFGVLLAFVCLVVAAAQGGSVRNGNFGRSVTAPADLAQFQEKVQKLRSRGWTCPDAKDWPWSWDGQGDGIKIEWPATGGVNNDRYGRISGGITGYVNGYWGKFFKASQILTFQARGKGTLRVGLMAYKFSDDHKEILPGGGVPGFDIKVDSAEWVRYRYLMKKPDYELNGHPSFQALEGIIDFDDVDIIDSDPVLDSIVAEENKLYGTGALVENLRWVAVDAPYQERVAAYTDAVSALRAKAATLDPELVQGLEKTITTLDSYVLTKGVKTVLAEHYNDMLVLTRLCRRLSGGKEDAIKPVTATVAAVPADTPGLYPGRRDARPDTVTITDVRSSKVRYVENEAATTTATLVNKKAAAVGGTIKARMILDLDTVRDLAGAPFTIAPGETKKWSFAYNVGPETYGRSIEVEFVDGDGKTLDKWQEYYAVAAEFFRVHQHSYQTATKYWPADVFIFYFNQSHYFAHEPTDLGIQPFDAEVYLSGQPGYRVNVPTRKAQIAGNKRTGIATTFYQTGAFCGQMGYEEVRKHPEYVLYEKTGQFAVDPIYGGWPNPMEIASPLEVGPKRKDLKTKPYLDRIYTPWQHVGMNMAMEEAVVYATECIRDYAREWGFDGIYWDGSLGIGDGYGYDGKPNVPSGKYEDYVALSARNHRLFNQILKRNNPNFGTWLNWASRVSTSDWARNAGIKIWLGTGVKGDPLNDAFRAATTGKNVMILDELQSVSGLKYQELLEGYLLPERDHSFQKYGASIIKGYFGNGVDMNEPGPTKWGWPTWNYVLAQLIASQTHMASFFIPSYRPSLQFMTRYSRFIWAPDIKTVPGNEVEKTLAVTAPEEIWWKRLVYQRKTDRGYDLIVHLVRIPPTEKVDFNWADEPLPLAGTTITADVGAATLETAQACRPYYFEEAQQTVAQILSPDVRTGKITVTVPPFRYHTMVVFRVEQRN